jgi:hypothetical protein
MYPALKHTAWPSVVITDNVKELLGKFFTIVDLPDPEAGKRLADEIFTEDGIMAAATGKSIGFEGMYFRTIIWDASKFPVRVKTNPQPIAISKSREHAWDTIVSRRHNVIKVFASDAEGHDLMLIGKLIAAVKSGKEDEIGFTARIVMEKTNVGLRMKLYEVGSVSNYLSHSRMPVSRSNGNTRTKRQLKLHYNRHDI